MDLTLPLLPLCLTLAHSSLQHTVGLLPNQLPALLPLYVLLPGTETVSTDTAASGSHEDRDHTLGTQDPEVPDVLHVSLQTSCGTRNALTY